MTRHIGLVPICLSTIYSLEDTPAYSSGVEMWGARLKRRREELGFTQEALSMAAGWKGNSTIAGYEARATPPPRRSLQRLVGPLKASLAQLAGDEPFEPVTSGVTATHDPQPGERLEITQMPTITHQAASLAHVFMDVPEEVRDEVWNEAVALFRRRSASRVRGPMDDAEGDR